MSPQAIQVELSRRHFLSRTGAGIGAAALGHAAESGRALRRAGTAAFHPEGEADHLAHPGGGAVTIGPLRPQAGPRLAIRRGLAGIGPQRPATHRHDRRAETLSRARRCSSSGSTASPACG